jgi:very-long-chain enoyl-CoA reductase
MPLMNLFKNCFYYWVIGGVILGYNLYSNTLISEKTTVGNLIALPVLFAILQACNFYCHWILRSLRTKKLKRNDNLKPNRLYPTGFLFDYVSCANYFFEICVWIVFSSYSRVYAGNINACSLI